MRPALLPLIFLCSLIGKGDTSVSVLARRRFSLSLSLSLSLSKVQVFSLYDNGYSTNIFLSPDHNTLTHTTVSFSFKKNKMFVPSNLLPHWLDVLLSEKFYNACIIHEEAKKNEKNIYCLDCCMSLCPHCLNPHRPHRLLQIRRYVYHDVVRLDDAAKLIDCSSVQSYISNSAKVVFLNQRPQTRNCRGSGNICSTCDRSLQDPYLFCSLYCKIDYVLRTEGGLSKYLLECKFMSLPESGLDDGQMTPDSVLEPAGSTRTSSGSCGFGEVGCLALACTATTEIVRKKRSSMSTYRTACRPVFSPVSEISAGLMNRRKGTPHRAPLY